MKDDRAMTHDECGDAELVSLSLAGDRDAFNRIVSRYQTLICSLAYSRVGNLSQSEDVAQETFVTAWKHLRLLREPAKLRAWLCGIVRNRVQKNLRREGRDPVHHGESLELARDLPDEEALPSEQAVSKEEEAILWRSLENIPEIYRAPLILFYREHQSIEALAAELGLTEDAAKQRLSRGRKLLQKKVKAFVEKTLRRSAPNRAFSSAVLSALPAGPATTLGAGSAAKSAAVTKTIVLGTWLAPLIGIVGGISAHWLIVRAAPSKRERRLKRAAFIGLWIFVLTWCVAGQLVMNVLRRHFGWGDRTYFPVMAGFWWFYAVVLATVSCLMFQRVSAIRREFEQSGGIPEKPGRPAPFLSGIVLVGGVHLACFSWLIGLAFYACDLVWAFVVAAVMAMLAVWHFVQVRGETGASTMRAIGRHQALVWGALLTILNLRLAPWLASAQHADLAEIHRLLPMWIIPLLTVALVGWIWLLLKMTKAKHRHTIPDQTPQIGKGAAGKGKGFVRIFLLFVPLASAAIRSW